jgi:hypothetical protein
MKILMEQVAPVYILPQKVKRKMMILTLLNGKSRR